VIVYAVVDDALPPRFSIRRRRSMFDYGELLFAPIPVAVTG
jgi:hypothetical protein